MNEETTAEVFSVVQKEGKRTVNDYALNEKRLQEKAEKCEALKQTVKLLGNVLDTKTFGTDEASGLLKVITDYTPVKWLGTDIPAILTTR